MSILAQPLPQLSPMGAHMLECERREGREPITPDNYPAWLQLSDWSPWPVLSIANDELHIIAINAVGRKGALRRLIDGAATAGLCAVIVEPMGAMPAILAKWGWQRRVVGKGFHAREEWRPS